MSSETLLSIIFRTARGRNKYQDFDECNCNSGNDLMEVGHWEQQKSIDRQEFPHGFLPNKSAAG